MDGEKDGKAAQSEKKEGVEMRNTSQIDIGAFEGWDDELSSPRLRPHFRRSPSSIPSCPLYKTHIQHSNNILASKIRGSTTRQPPATQISHRTSKEKSTEIQKSLPTLRVRRLCQRYSGRGRDAVCVGELVVLFKELVEISFSVGFYRN